ncbi:MAG TPA: GNAT family protein [Rhodanobacter sp.]|jgi:RimJ/RimL family protein N-acetyltransferase|nr:GNAT family protein [Rhodanobacter sp.]
MNDQTIPATLELTDGRLRLRPWQNHDATALLDAVRESIEGVGRWLPWCHAGYAADDAMAWIAHCQARWRSGDHFAFGIFDAASGEVLGGVGLGQRNRLHRSANLGYWVRQLRHRQGIAASAAGLVAQFGFARLQLVRIEIIALPDNRASRRTAEKLGARFEAIARQRLWARGQPHDAAVYALIAQDLD